MSIFKEIKEMVGKRLAYKLWLKKEEYDSLLYTDTRALAFVRMMTLLFSIGTLAAIVFISTKKDTPLPVFLILGFFFLSFFLVFLLKAFSHKEVTFTSFDNKIIIQKKRFNTILAETAFTFSQIQKLTLSKVTRTETKEGHGRQSRTHFEMVMEFKDAYNIHFALITDPVIALETAGKLANFTGVKLVSKL
jgi:hypothetical protein